MIAGCGAVEIWAIFIEAWIKFASLLVLENARIGKICEIS